MKTLRIAFGENQEGVQLWHLPGFADWVQKILPRIEGRLVAKNAFEQSMKIGEKTYPPCTHQGETVYGALVQIDGSVAVVSGEHRNALTKEEERIYLSKENLAMLVSGAVWDSFHPHYAQWADVWDYPWE